MALARLEATQGIAPHISVDDHDRNGKVIGGHWIMLEKPKCETPTGAPTEVLGDATAPTVKPNYNNHPGCLRGK